VLCCVARPSQPQLNLTYIQQQQEKIEVEENNTAALKAQLKAPPANPPS